MYKKLPKNTRPLALEIETEDFVEEWKKCVTDKQSDLSILIDMMNPVFIKWENLLSKKDLSDDIGYTTLCKLISPNPEEAKETISLWLQYIENTSDFMSEIQYIFIERMRKFKYVPTLASSIMVEYVVAKDLKLALYHHIRYVSRLINREALYHSDIESNLEIQIEEELPDFFLLKNIDADLNPWQSYLFFMIKEGYSSVKRSELTRIHRRNLYKEEQTIWHLIKQKL